MLKNDDGENGFFGKIKVVAVVIVILLIVYFILTFTLGLGGGKGNKKGNGDGTQKGIPLGTKASISKNVEIKIEEDEVWINDKQVKNKKEFKSYIEKINDDDKKYTLVRKRDIQYTYDWVIEALDELNIEYTDSKKSSKDD